MQKAGFLTTRLIATFIGGQDLVNWGLYGLHVVMNGLWLYFILEDQLFDGKPTEY